MNVQGRRGGLSCDNKGECLIHKKKKKKKWLVAGKAADQRLWPPCSDRSDPRPTTSGAGPKGREPQPPLQPRLKPPTAVGKNQPRLPHREAGGSCTSA